MDPGVGTSEILPGRSFEQCRMKSGASLRFDANMFNSVCMRLLFWVGFRLCVLDVIRNNRGNLISPQQNIGCLYDGLGVLLCCILL